jgi:hypothetical protein
MTRRLLNLLTLLSLLLCVAVCVLWRLPGNDQRLSYVRWRVNGMKVTGTSIWFWRYDGDSGMRWESYWEVFDTLDDRRAATAKERLPPQGFHTRWYEFPTWTDPGDLSPLREWTWWRFHGDWGEQHATGSDDVTVIMRRSWSNARLPLCVPPLLFAILPTWRAVRFLPGRARRRAGRCPSCGYDLRATPDRCPECGSQR